MKWDVFFFPLLLHKEKHASCFMHQNEKVAEVGLIWDEAAA
jgi:hypothetical protein